jgi:hypothetical protein
MSGYEIAYVETLRKHWVLYFDDELYFLHTFMCFLSISFTLILFAAYRAAYAGSVNNGGNCSTGDNKLQIGSFQFWSDCNSVTYCTDKGICTPKGCRRDEFPFGYAQGASLPPKCPGGQFCPDEGSACQNVLPVGSPCQLNRDGIKVVYSLRN